jgi:hypothetical protein
MISIPVVPYLTFRIEATEPGHLNPPWCRRTLETGLRQIGGRSGSVKPGLAQLLTRIVEDGLGLRIGDLAEAYARAAVKDS